MMQKLITLLLSLVLAGCGVIATHEARDPLARHSLIGGNVIDLIDCAGIPDRFIRTSDETGLLQYSFTNSSQGFAASLMGASIDFGGASSCKAAITVLREGTVADIAFPQSHSSGINVPYAACSPILSECLTHPNRTALPANFDAFVYLVGLSSPAPAGATPAASSASSTAVSAGESKR